MPNHAPRVTLPDCLHGVSRGKHSSDMLDREPTASDDRFPAEYGRVDRDASEQFFLGLGLTVQSCSPRVRQQEADSLTQ